MVEYTPFIKNGVRLVGAYDKKSGKYRVMRVERKINIWNEVDSILGSIILLSFSFLRLRGALINLAKEI